MASRILATVERPSGDPIPAREILPDGRLVVSGWAIETGGAPLRIRAQLDGAEAVVTDASRVRDDVALAHADLLCAGRSGFVLLVPTPTASLERSARLRVEALAPDGVALLLDDRVVELSDRSDDGEEDDQALFGTAPRGATPRPAGAPHDLAVLLVSNNFNLEGAPHSLLDLGIRLREAGFRTRVLGPAEGPLAPRWRAAGVDAASVGDPGHVLHLDDYRARIRRLAALEARSRPDVVLANTLDTFWAVDLATELGVPAVWVIRESVDLETYFLGRWPYAIARRALSAFERAARVVFVAHATAELFQRFVPPDRVEVIWNGLDTMHFELRLARASREQARRQLRLPLDRPVLTCVGTTCQRKGQRVLVEAMAQLVARTPRPLCVLVGSRPSMYLAILERRIAALGLGDDVLLVPELPDPLPYYRAADVCLCPSFEESLPRVVIEAMACGVPVVASSVNGIPELIEEGVHGRLVPPGDPDALARAVARVLDDPDWVRVAGLAALERAREHFSIERMVREYTSLLHRVAGAPAPTAMCE